MTEQHINKHIKIVDDEILVITLKFAENNLSKACLDVADFKTDKHYEWTMGDNAYAVLYELPTIFNIDLVYIYLRLPHYCYEYMRKKGITGDNFEAQFNKNCKKVIKYKD